MIAPRSTARIISRITQRDYNERGECIRKIVETQYEGWTQEDRTGAGVQFRLSDDRRHVNESPMITPCRYRAIFALIPIE